MPSKETLFISSHRYGCSVANSVDKTPTVQEFEELKQNGLLEVKELEHILPIEIQGIDNPHIHAKFKIVHINSDNNPGKFNDWIIGEDISTKPHAELLIQKTRVKNND